MRVEGREDCWEGVRGGWGECACAVDAWEAGRFATLVVAGLSAGVWDSSAVKALAREAERSSARILSRACFSSVSAWIALSSAAWARSSVSLQKTIQEEALIYRNPSEWCAWIYELRKWNENYRNPTINITALPGYYLTWHTHLLPARPQLKIISRATTLPMQQNTNTVTQMHTLRRTRKKTEHERSLRTHYSLYQSKVRVNRRFTFFSSRQCITKQKQLHVNTGLPKRF